MFTTIDNSYISLPYDKYIKTKNRKAFASKISKG